MTELATTDSGRPDGTRRTAGVIQGIDARVRMAVAAAFAVTAVSLDDLRPLIAALLCAVLLAAVARLPAARTLGRMLGMDAFMVPVLVLLPFTVAGDAIAAVGPWQVTAEGVQQAAKIVITANAVVLAVFALVGTIEPAVFASALRALGVPAKIAHMLMLTTRYIAVFESEYARLRLAMRARAFRPGGNLHTWRSLGYLFGMLLVHSFGRAERIVDAMNCRGFAGRLAAPERPPLAAADWAFTGIATLALTGLAAVKLLA